MPGHAAEAEIGQRMAEGGQFPVENGHHPWLRRVKQHVAQTKIAMGDRYRPVIGRQMGRQPGRQPVQRLDPVARRLPPLARPAADLPLEVVPRLAEIVETDGPGADSVQAGQGVGAIEDVPTTAELGARLLAEYRQARASLAG